MHPNKPSAYTARPYQASACYCDSAYCSADNESTQMHHIAFELKDWAQIQAACDFLGSKNIPIIWGPGRHGPGHNIYTYHRNPDDQIVEMFTELDKMLDESLGYFDPRPWHRDRPQVPKVWTMSRDIWGLPPTLDYLRQRE